MDFLVKDQVDEATGETYANFGVYNDEEGRYKQFRTPDTELDMLYIMKANAQINNDAYTEVQQKLGSGRLQFLIDDKDARKDLMSSKRGANMPSHERAKLLKPFRETSELKEELMNLREKPLTSVSGKDELRLEIVNRKIRKDRVSALAYGLYYIKTEEEPRLRRKSKRFNRDQLKLLITKRSW